MIGLVDIDLQTSTATNLCPPNIEIMKLATYYKTEENLFCRLINLDETELTSYDKIYIFSEADTQPQIPEAFRRANNVIYGGTAFTKGIYKPFENDLIDYTIPRTFIYKPLLAEKYVAGLKDTVITHILDDSYYRMYAGESKLPITPLLPKHRMFIYDRDFFVPDWRNIIDKIIERNPSSIQPIHPIICKTINNYFGVREYNKISKNTTIILDLNIPLDDTPLLMKKYKNKFLADIRESSNVYITLGGTFDTRGQYLKDFIYKLNLLYVFWSQDIPLKIKYIKPQIGYTDPIANISRLVEIWTASNTNLTKSIHDRIPKDKKSTEIRPERSEGRAIIERFPSAKTLFYQTRETVKKGGFWKYGY